MNLNVRLDGKILIKDSEVNFNKYISEIVGILLSTFKEKYKMDLFLTTDENMIKSIFIVVIGIRSYLNNLLSCDCRDEINDIEIGDIVYYNNCKCKYIGIEKIYGNTKIKLEYKPRKVGNLQLHDYTYVDIKNKNQISKYYGDSDKINKMTGIRNKKNNSGKALLAKLLDLDPEKFCRVVKRQVVFVFESKKEMEYILNNIKIRIEKKQYNLCEILPCKYYSDIDNGTYLTGNLYKEKPVLLFTSRLDIAKELIIHNKECKSLILLGADTYKNYIDVIFENIMRKLDHKKFEKLIVYNSFSDVQDVDRVLDYKLDVYSWNKGTLINKIKNKTYPSDNKELMKYLDTNINCSIIDDKDINVIMTNVRKGLVELIKTNEQIIDKKNFIRIGFKIYNVLKTIIFPVKEYKNSNYMETCFDDWFNKLKNILNENDLYIENISLLQPVFHGLKKFYEILYYENPKVKCLKQKFNYKATVVCNDLFEKNLLIKNIGINEDKIITLNQVNSSLKNKNLIFLSFYNKSKEYQIGNYLNNDISNILYASEVFEYNSKIRSFNKMMGQIAKNNLLCDNKYSEIDYLNEIKIDFDFLKSEIKKYKDNDNPSKNNESIDEDEYIKDENTIERYNRDNIEQEYFSDVNYNINQLFQVRNRSSNNQESINAQGLGIVKKKVIFEDNRYCYLTSDYLALCIDKGKELEKSIDLLKQGDQIVFIEEISADEPEVLFDKIINSSIFKEKYKRHYENMRYWKKALKEYRNLYNMDYNSLSNELRIYNVNKSNVAIRQWIETSDNVIIGPREPEVYEAIADITLDNKMKEHWKDIYESNNIIRDFRTRFKKTFKSIVKDFALNKEQNNNEIEKLVKNVFGNLNQYVNIVKIQEIEDVSQNMKYVKTNSLIDSDK
ncbi:MULTISPECIES: DrmE family protein [Clostridium]|uniref:DrmE family protein n=1 Tax=Clostridium TaxID=1485 RepID=UPI000826F8DA|nr:MULTISPECIES: DrmE family protein [Clostridium]PJI06834.1 hypothetical protein CUB90_02650 [Clostridium sp. CT7]